MIGPFLVEEPYTIGLSSESDPTMRVGVGAGAGVGVGVGFDVTDIFLIFAMIHGTNSPHQKLTFSF